MQKFNTFPGTGFAWYNGIHLELERRFANGVGFQIFYDMANVLNATGTVKSAEPVTCLARRPRISTSAIAF